MLAVRVTRAAQGGKGPRLTARLSRGEGRWRQRSPAAPAAARPRRRRALGRAVPRCAGAGWMTPRCWPRLASGAGRSGELRAKPYSTTTLLAADRGVGRTRGRAARRRAAVDPADAGAGGDRCGCRRRDDRAAARTAAHLAINRRAAAGAGAADPAAQPVRRHPGRSRRPAGRAGARRSGRLSRRRWQTTRCGRACSASPRLGLAEIVRPRVHPPLHELLAGPHAAGLAALRQCWPTIWPAPGTYAGIAGAPAVVAALQADPVALPDLARRAGRALILRSDPRCRATAWVMEDRPMAEAEAIDLPDLRPPPVGGAPAVLQPRCADVDLGRWLTGQYRVPAGRPSWTKTRRLGRRLIRLAA